MEPIFKYVDYRQYLKDYYEEKKQNNKSFSLKTFADKAGFKARDFIYRVMHGKRNLSKSGIFMLSKALNFSEKESSYFENLVAFNQAKTVEEKDYHFSKLMNVGKFTKYQKLKEEQFDYFSQWYHGAIRSILPVMDFKDDFKKLGNFLVPPISESQAKKSAEFLLAKGLLKRDSKGNYSVQDAMISSGDEVRSIALSRFHKTIIELAEKSINTCDPSKRDISGVTMSISEQGLQKLKKEIQLFRKKVMAIANEDNNEDRVYQLECLFFPLSKEFIDDNKKEK